MVEMTSGVKAARMAKGPLAVAIFATICLIVLLAPMRSVILWSIILAILFFRMNETLAVRLNGRNRAALLTLTVILLTAVIPFVVVSMLVIGQINELAARSDQIAASLVPLLTGAIEHLPAIMKVEIEKLVASSDLGARDVGKLVVPALSYTFSLGGNILVSVGLVFSALYVTFFLLRDWRQIAGFLSQTVPLRVEEKALLSNRLAVTVNATVRGIILVAIAQAVVAGVVYWLLGLNAYAVLAVLTFVGCLIPAIGSGLVWVPVAIYFLLTGDYTSGLTMIAAGVLVISMVDNILRPRLIAGKTSIPDFLIFLSSFGGLAVVGFDGLFLGPIVAAFFIESWKVFLNSRQSGGDDRMAGDADVPNAS